MHFCLGLPGVAESLLAETGSHAKYLYVWVTR